MHDQWVLPQLQEAFLKAALDTSLWHGALDQMATLVGASRAQLIGVDQRGEIAFNVMTGIDDAYVSDFLGVEGHHDASINYRIAASVGSKPGAVVWEEHYDAMQARIGDNAYTEVCDRHDQPFGCQTSLAVEDGTLVGLALMRTRKAGRTHHEQRAFFAAAASAAQTALRLQQSIEQRGMAITHGALELVGTPVVLVDGFGRVATMTGAADTLVTTHPALGVQERMLVAARSSETRSLHKMLRAVLNRDQLEASILLHAPGALPLLVKIQALPDTEMGFGFQPKALLSLGSSVGDGTRSIQVLREQYDLTAAEGEVVALLARGMRRADIAQHRSTSLGTVQQQIKTVFGKTGVNREAELLALVTAVGN
ncbi:MAG: hypothetical protein ABW210_14420 [Achromobacter sp.]